MFAHSGVLRPTEGHLDLPGTDENTKSSVPDGSFDGVWWVGSRENMTLCRVRWDRWSRLHRGVTEVKCNELSNGLSHVLRCEAGISWFPAGAVVCGGWVKRPLR